MPRKITDGVGRGNGDGSKSTQFKPDMPSANPEGRRRARPKRKSHTDIAAAFHNALSAEIVVRRNGRVSKVPWVEAMALAILEDFPKAKLREKLEIIRFLLSGDMPISSPTSRAPDPAALDQFLEGLARETEAINLNPPRKL